MRDSKLNERAGLYYTIGDFRKERADRDDIIKTNSSELTRTKYGFQGSHQDRAEQYRYIGEINKAVSDYEAAVKNVPEPSDLMHLAYLYENSGRPSQAVKTYSTVVDIGYDKKKNEPTTDGDHALYRRANLYLKLAEYDKALADANKLITYDKESVERQAFRAKVLDQMGRKAQADEQRKAAVAHLTSDINDVPNSGSTKGCKSCAYSARADFYAANEQWKNALKDYLIALSDDPNSIDTLSCARMYLKLGEYDKAIDYYAKAVSPTSNDNDMAEHYIGLAQVHLLQNKPELAVEDCNKAILEGVSPREGDASYWRAKAYRKLGKNDLAKIDENEALGLEFSPLPDLL